MVAEEGIIAESIATTAPVVRAQDTGMNISAARRIMIFGRPGSGKSTFALWLAARMNLPLHHLDKHCFQENWVLRDYDEFIGIQKEIVDADKWIIDGNSSRSFEMRWCRADLIIYFNFNRFLCTYRVFKRLLIPNKTIDDKNAGCEETVRWSLIKYLWKYDDHVSDKIRALRTEYPSAMFLELCNDYDVDRLKQVFS